MRDTSVLGSGENELLDDTIDSSPREEPATPGLVHAEFEALFAPVRESNKRRRLSAGERPTLAEKLNSHTDAAPSSTPKIQQRAPDPLTTPAPHPVPSMVARDTSAQATPSASARPIPPGLSTPGPAKTPFRSKPRFVLSTKKAPSTQTPLRTETPAASQPTSPPERRRPAFVLPRSPSPSAAAEDIPAPFSPSSRTLHRRGRRAGVPGYTPGGMAAEVRSWVLEMGSKREHRDPNRLNADEAEFPGRLGQYLVAARIVNASQTALSSSGSLAFIQAAHGLSSTVEGKTSELLNIMAMGPPRSKPDSRRLLPGSGGAQTVSVRVGDLVGVHRGLAWEVELQTFQALGAAHCLRPVPTEHDDRKQRWLVAMEWDLIEAAT